MKCLTPLHHDVIVSREKGEDLSHETNPNSIG